MSRVWLSPFAARQVQRERTWLYNNRGPERADAFEVELRHTCELLSANPRMGSVWRARNRHLFLLESRFHVYYRVDEASGDTVVFRIRHEAQRPLKG